MNYTYSKCECPSCGRKILVQRVLVGTNHSVSVHAQCAECLAKAGVDENFKVERPDAAKDIEGWIQSSASSTRDEDV